jgi:hypothetical protein
VAVTIHDLRGRIVRRFDLGARVPGKYRGAAAVAWDGRDESGLRRGGGVYFARLWVDGVATGEGRRIVFSPSRASPSAEPHEAAVGVGVH